MTASINRREALRIIAGTGAAAAGIARGRPAFAADETAMAIPSPEDRKLILILFGGGTRSSESIADPRHRYVPRLWNDLVPRGTLFTNMRVEHLVVHPNCAASIKTGHWEWDDLDWSRPPAHPSIFEIVRKGRGLPDTEAWAFVYASILAQTGLSRAEGFGPRFAANVAEPPTIPRSTAEQMDRLMMAARATGSYEAELRAVAECAGWPARRATHQPPACALTRPGVGSTSVSKRGGKRTARPATTPCSPIWPATA